LRPTELHRRVSDDAPAGPGDLDGLPSPVCQIEVHRLPGSSEANVDIVNGTTELGLRLEGAERIRECLSCWRLVLDQVEPANEPATQALRPDGPGLVVVAHRDRRERGLPIRRPEKGTVRDELDEPLRLRLLRVGEIRTPRR